MFVNFNFYALVRWKQHILVRRPLNTILYWKQLKLKSRRKYRCHRRKSIKIAYTQRRVYLGLCFLKIFLHCFFFFLLYNVLMNIHRKSGLKS